MTISQITAKVLQYISLIRRFITVSVSLIIDFIAVHETTLIVLLTLSLVIYSHLANQRAERLFVGADRPLIDVTPIAIRQRLPARTHAETLFSIANYSAFPAYKIGLDLKYEEVGWIGEWSKADLESAGKKGVEGVVGDKWYLSPPEIPSAPRLSRLAPGERAQWLLRGALDLENRVCSKKNKGIPVLVRVTWENDPNKGHVFDEIHRYTLICTANTGGVHPLGRSFTFIPEGVIAQKDRSTETSPIAKE